MAQLITEGKKKIALKCKTEGRRRRKKERRKTTKLGSYLDRFLVQVGW